jgi:transposase-like protein
MGVLTEQKNRSVGDILIACLDGLTGFPDAVRSIYPDTRVQLCVQVKMKSDTC